MKSLSEIVSAHRLPGIIGERDLEIRAPVNMYFLYRHYLLTVFGLGFVSEVSHAKKAQLKKFYLYCTQDLGISALETGKFLWAILVCWRGFMEETRRERQKKLPNQVEPFILLGERDFLFDYYRKKLCGGEEPDSPLAQALRAELEYRLGQGEKIWEMPVEIMEMAVRARRHVA